MAFDIAGAKQAGYSDQEIQDFLKSQGGQNQGQQQGGVISGPLEQSGLYNIPVLGGLLGRGIVEPITKGAEMVSEGVAAPILDLLTKGKITGQNHFMNQQDFNSLTQGDFKNAIVQGGEQGLSTGLASLGASSLPGLIKGGVAGGVNVAKGATSFVKMPTKELANKAIESAAANATKSGVTDTWHDIAQEGLDAVSGKPPSVQKAMQRLIAEETPTAAADATDVSNPTVTPNQMLELRRSLGSRLPSTFFEKLLGNAINNKAASQNAAADTLRRIVSARLKDVAPDIKNADSMYSFYSKYGSPPDWAKGVILAEGLKHLGKAIPVLGPILDKIPVP